MYSLDFRKKSFVCSGERKPLHEGGFSEVLCWQSKCDALEQILDSQSFSKVPTKLDWEAIKRDVEENPDSYIRERAAKFGVSFSGVQYALARLGMTRKKTLHPS